MNRKLYLVACLLLAPGLVVLNGAEFGIDWHSLNPGGASQGWSYVLKGGVETSVGSTTITGGDFSLTGGFWSGSAQTAPEALYVANYSYVNGTIERFTLDGVSSIFATNSLYGTVGLAFDNAGNLYAGNYGNNTIEKFAPSGLGSLFANSGLGDPNGLAFDKAGNLYVANQSNNTIEKFTGGIPSVFAGSGLFNPVGLALDSAGNLYVANYDNSTIQKFTPEGVGSVFASSGLSAPTGLAFDKAGNLYVANQGNDTIEKFTPDGARSIFATNGLFRPWGLALDRAGNLYVVNQGNATIEKFTPDGVSSVFATGLSAPYFIVIGAASALPSTPDITTLVVPGTANPWLAGMTNGFHEATGDVTPDESPVLLTNFTAGARLQFTASGSASYGGAASGPAGLSGSFVNHAAQDGIGAIANSPVNALIGVFLDDAQPDASAPTPSPLDFGSVDSQNYVVLQPALKQPFYIGSGTNLSGLLQSVIVPANGTRLFLGIQDGLGWYNNSGSFTVVVSGGAPGPGTVSAVIFDNTTGGDNGGFGVTETSWLAGKFCAAVQSYTLDSLSLLLNSQDFSGAAGPPSTIRLQIYSHDALHNKPLADTGLIMNLSGFTNPVTPPNGYGLVKWIPASPFRLEPNTCYWAVLSREGGGNIGEIASSSQPTGAAATLGGSRSADGGKTWQAADPGFNYKMLIEGTVATPGPSGELAIFDNSNGVETGGYTLTATTWLAGRFCPRAQPYQLDSVSFLLSSGNLSGGTVRLQIYANDSVKDLPSTSTGVMMNLAGLTGASTPGAAWITWVPATPLRLSPNSCYWAELSRDDGGNVDLGPVGSYTIPSGDASAFGIARSQDAGATWGPDVWDPNPNFNLKMIISGTPVSTPTPQLAADNSTPIPGGSGNFTSLPIAPALSGDNLVFYGGGAGGQQGIYSTIRGSQTVTRIADLGTPIPNGTGNFLSFGTDAGIIIVGGNVLFNARGSDNQQGLYLAQSSMPTTPIRIVDSSTAIPNGAGTFAEFLNLPAFNGAEVAFVANGSAGQQALYKVGAISPPQVGSPQLIADTTTAIPGGSGNFTAFPSSPALSGSDVAFIANGSAGQQGLYKVAAISPPQVGSPLRIADTATPIPNGVGNFTAFGSDQAHPIDPAASGERLAFVGSGSGGQQGVYTTVAAISPPQVGSLAPVADTATSIPGGSGNFTSFSAVSVSETDTAFLGHGVGGQTGIYDMTGGHLLKITAVGDRIGGKMIAGLNFSRNGLWGDPVAFEATFDDGSQGIYSIDVVPPAAELRITITSISASELQFTFPIAAGRAYTIESRADLVGGEWALLSGATASDNGGIRQLTIPTSPTEGRQFYRVKQLP